MAALDLHRLTKRYAPTVTAVEDVSFNVADGEVVAVIGPSGSGKSTLLRMIAGLARPTSGTVRLGGRDLTGVAPEGRDVAVVSQAHTLYPHLSVSDNLSFGLRTRPIPSREAATTIRRVAAALQIDHLLSRRPDQLSGGQRQRVALGRALVRRPALFLLDEPLSNLDAGLRADVRASILEIHRESGAPMVLVTHDQSEALAVADRVVVMTRGRALQVASPDVIYRTPATVEVALAIGAPQINLVYGRVRMGAFTSHDGVELTTGRVILRDGPTVIGVRPHLISLSDTNYGSSGAIPILVESVEPQGPMDLVRAALPSGASWTVQAPAETAGRGDRRWATVDARHVLAFDSETGRRL